MKGSDVTTTVSIPFYGDSEMLGRCLRSLYHQTHKDFRVLVIADGVEPDTRRYFPNDSRFEVYTLPENRGAYFARAVALEATDTSHHAVVDADDWVEPHWLETMLGTGASAVQHGSRFVEDGDQSDVVMWKHARRELATKLIHYTSHTGVYETQRLRQAGGYSPAFRMSYDSLLVSVLRLQGDVAIVDEPLYHRRVHRDSLTQASATRIGSAQREPIKRKLDAAYRKMYRVRKNPERVQAILDSLTPQQMWDEVRTYAEKVKGV